MSDKFTILFFIRVLVDGVDARDVTGARLGVDEEQISSERLLCFRNDGLKGYLLDLPLLMKMREAGRTWTLTQLKVLRQYKTVFGIFQTDELPVRQLYIITLTH